MNWSHKRQRLCREDVLLASTALLAWKRCSDVIRHGVVTTMSASSDVVMTPAAAGYKVTRASQSVPIPRRRGLELSITV